MGGRGAVTSFLNNKLSPFALPMFMSPNDTCTQSTSRDPPNNTCTQPTSRKTRQTSIKVDQVSMSTAAVGDTPYGFRHAVVNRPIQRGTTPAHIPGLFRHLTMYLIRSFHANSSSTP
ncbi:hypothetical protein BgiBS90_028608 [Biomphalaria glabrata]|nr:hypothetical protein BgiBS90_028608 [Biomphalaria glabrata]